jgi:hypothetical protein
MLPRSMLGCVDDGCRLLCTPTSGCLCIALVFDHEQNTGLAMVTIHRYRQASSDHGRVAAAQRHRAPFSLSETCEPAAIRSGLLHDCSCALLPRVVLELRRVCRLLCTPDWQLSVRASALNHRTNTLGLRCGSHYQPLPSASSDRGFRVTALSGIAHRSALSETCKASGNSQSLRSAIRLFVRCCRA